MSNTPCFSLNLYCKGTTCRFSHHFWVYEIDIHMNNNNGPNGWNQFSTLASQFRPRFPSIYFLSVYISLPVSLSLLLPIFLILSNDLFSSHRFDYKNIYTHTKRYKNMANGSKCSRKNKKR
jgi:hypothetical protein